MYGAEPKKERFCLNNEKRAHKVTRDECPTNLVDVLSKQERLDQQKKLIQDMTIEKHHNNQKRLRLYNNPEAQSDPNFDQEFEQMTQMQLDGTAKASLDLPAAESAAKKDKAGSVASIQESDDAEAVPESKMFKIINDVRRMSKEKYELLRQCHENLHGRKAESMIPEEI